MSSSLPTTALFDVAAFGGHVNTDDPGYAVLQMRYAGESQAGQEDWEASAMPFLRHSDANEVIRLLSLDFVQLERQLDEELRARQKVGPEAAPAHSLPVEELRRRFESGDATFRMRLLLSELLGLLDGSGQPAVLLESSLYQAELGRMLAVAVARLPLLQARLRDVARGLLVREHGAALLMQLLRSEPHALPDLVSAALDLPDQQRALPFLAQVAELSPRAAHAVRWALWQAQAHAGLLLQITLRQLEDEPELLAAALAVAGSGASVAAAAAAAGGGSAAWFRDWLRRSAEEASVRALRERLLQRMQACVRRLEDAGPHAAEEAEATLLLRCAAGLVAPATQGGCAVRLSAGEGETWLEAAGRAARCGRGERLPRVALALLLLWPGLGKLVPRRSLLQTLQALQARADALLLLVAAQFHAGQSGAVLDLARQLLLGHVVQGAGGSRGAGAAGELGTLFTEELYPEAQLARQALQLRAEEAAGLQCQYLLLRSRLLSRHRVELHDWILEFLRHARRPMHPLAPALIIEYARCCCALPAAPSLPAPADFAMRAPSEAELRSLLAPAATAAAAAAASGELELGQALAILLALQLDELAQQPGARGKVGFRREFLADLPLRQAVQFARQHEPLLYPSLLSLSIAVCPQRFMPGPLLLAEAARGEALEEALEEDEPEATQRAGTSADELEALLEQEAVALTEASTRDRALAVLARVCRDPQAEWAGGRLARPLQALARRLLELPAGGAGVRALQDAFRRAAEALQAVASWELARLCADAFRDTSLQVPPRAPDLAEDPLALLRCDSRLFRCPPLLAVLLQALNAALTASRRLIHARLQQQQQPPSSAPPSAALQLQPQASAQTAARAEEHSTLVLAQDSAALQLLLEACLPREGEEDGEGCLEEVRALVCGFAHELFIENPLLIKLLHFQTYDVRLLPCTTRRIGSMHVCLDFLPELLAQPQSERQAFALHLAAHLCELYPLPKSMQLARHILQLLRPATVAGQQQQQQQRPTPIPPLPLEAALAALPRICRAFPFLLAECSEVLNELRPSSALAASTTSFSILDARIQHAFMLSARATLQSSVS